MKKGREGQIKDQGKMTGYQKAGIAVAILALLLSVLLSFHRFVALDSHLNLAAKIEVENLGRWKTVPIKFHYILSKRNTSAIIVNDAETIDLVAVAEPIPDTNKHTVTLNRDFHISRGSGVGAYVFETDMYHQDERKRVTRFSVIVLPFLLHVFFTYTFLKILLAISLILSGIGLWKRYRDKRKQERKQRVASIRGRLGAVRRTSARFRKKGDR